MEGTTSGSPVSGLYEIFWAPGALMERLRERPHWIAALATVAILAALMAFLMQPYSARAALSMIPDNLPAEQRAAAIERTQSGGLLGLAVAPAMLLLKTLLTASILLGLATMLAGGGRFAPYFAACMHANLIQMVGGLVNFWILHLRGVDAVTTMMDLQWAIGLNLLVPTESPVIHTLLSSVSLFELWYVAVLVLAVEKISRCGRGQAVAAALTYWVLAVGVTAGLAVLTRAR
jgi:hypothetical protein